LPTVWPPHGQTVAERGATNETGRLRVLDRTTQVLHAAAETVRPGAAMRRARRALGLRRMGGLLEVWLKQASAAAVGAAERSVHFFSAAWRVLRT
jgi:hypothetical protein